MADASEIHIHSNSAEEVAFKLLKTIALIQGKAIHPLPQGSSAYDKKWLLDTYAECLLAVRSPQERDE